MEIGINIHNRFDIEVRDARTGAIKQEATAYNIVLNQMWADLASISNYFFRSIYFGTGTGTLSPTRTTLFNYLGDKTASPVESVMGIPVTYCKKKIVLNPEEYVGKVITEVGVFGGGLETHAMLQDSEGNQITINKTATDVVTIYATIFSLISEDPDLKLTSMPAKNSLLQYLSGTLSTIATPILYLGASDVPTHNRMDNTAADSNASIASSWAVRDVANKRLSTALSRFGVTIGNMDVAEISYSGIARMVLPSAARPQMPYTDVPIGSGDGTTRRFKLPSKNADLSSLVVKINGAAVASYVATKAPRFNYVYKTQYINGSSGDYGYVLRVPLLNTWYGRASGYTISTGIYAHGVLIQNSVTTGAVVFPGIDMTKGQLMAASPTDPIVAVPCTAAPFIKFFDVSGAAPVLSAFTIGTPIASKPYYISFSPDGQHFTMVLENSKMLRYKKNGTVFEKLPEIPGEPSLHTYPSVYTATGNAEWHGNEYFVARTYTTGSVPTIVVYKRTGDSYAFTTLAETHTGSVNSKCFFSDDFTKLVVPRTLKTIDVYSVNSDFTLTKYASVPLSAGANTQEAALGIKLANNHFGIMSVAGVCNLYRFNEDYTSAEAIETSTLSGYAINAPQYCYHADQNTFILSTGAYALIYDITPRITEITFDTPPAAGDAITASYLVNGVHKTDQYVIDAQFSIQFGEVT